MKKFSFLFTVIFWVITLTSSFTQGQTNQKDWIKKYPGIPMEYGIHWFYMDRPDVVEKMKQAGIEVIHTDIGLVEGVPRDPASQMQQLEDYELKIIPIKTRKNLSNPLMDWILHYSDAKYSVWEAEGNENYDANLEYSSSVMDKITDEDTSYLKLKNNASGLQNTALVWGPYYYQDLYSLDIDFNPYNVQYRADFRLKLEHNPIYPTELDNPMDEVCIIQVTYSTVSPFEGWHLDCTAVINEAILKRYQIQNYFLDFPLDYTLEIENDPCSGSSINPPHQATYHSRNTDDPPLPRAGKHHIEFKVIWLGKPQYLLSIDKVTLSDPRGRELINTPIGETRILVQANSLNDFNAENLITGWLGIDEPISIDQYKPIRLVTEILENSSQNKRPLWLTFMGMWDGVWWHRDNPFGTMHLSPWKEFKKRVGTGNIIQNFYMFDWPYCDTCSINPVGVDWRAANIEIVAKLNYQQAYDLDPYFGVSLQCGQQDADQAFQRNVARHEVLYNANLALMYGAKFLNLYTYIAQRYITDCESGLTCRGIVDVIPGPLPGGTLIYTDKYFMLRDTLSLRLKGLFGKTIKDLVPGIDSLNINPSIAYDNVNINYLRKIELVRDQGTEALNSYVDLRFFNNPVEYGDNYFMIINRWYSEPVYNRFRLKLKNLLGYYNWNLKNFMDSTNTTLLPDQNGNVTSPTDTILVGDAILYSIKPVVTDGGSLIADETVPSGTTLHDDMTIGESATLTINGTYIAKANITVKNGGKIVAGTDGKIVFDPGKGIIIDGNAEIKGASNNRLTLEFDNSTPVGVYVPSGRSLNISYCDVKKAQVGLKADPGSGIDIYYVNFSDCQNTGIALFGFGNGDNQSTQTPYVYKCNITNSGTGISVIDGYEIVIKENNISQCNLGIYLYMVNSAYVSKNNIIGKFLPNGSPLPAVYMQSSGGYLRNNILKQHSYGVQLAFSSPDMGVNTIENNTVCGLYVDLGSYPNLIQQLANPTCWYPIGGCNSIMNNGVYEGVPPQNAGELPIGAEIFLNNGDVQLSGGGNEISDDRTDLPDILTLPLIKGIRGSGDGQRELIADRNYWGMVGPSQNRFGSLNVVYEPTSDFCPLPYAPCSGDNEIVIQTSDGRIVDTLDSRQRESSELSELEELYANADKLFYSGDIEGAQIAYQQIINGQYTNEEKLFAYKKLYDIGEILREEDGYFITLQNALNSILAVETDTLLLKAFGQRSILCDVSRQEYLSAIEKFDEIIQQNPNSEEAVYAEIDIITTALNLDSTNTQLGKMNGGNYLVKGTSDYLTRVNDLLNSKFGNKTAEQETIIPKEYVLYQNYPNPFNPTTTIKFDLPKDGVVELGVYDILGRKITTLINEYRNAGSYEQNFNASSLASGIYLYRIKVNDFVSSKKMILVK